MVLHQRRCYWLFCTFLCPALRLPTRVLTRGSNSVQVPSGIAVGGSLVSGVTSADWIVSDEVGESAIVDISAAAGVALNVTISVIQVAISIAVELSLAALIVYPLEWKKKQRKTDVSSL